MIEIEGEKKSGKLNATPEKFVRTFSKEGEEISRLETVIIELKTESEKKFRENEKLQEVYLFIYLVFAKLILYFLFIKEIRSLKRDNELLNSTYNKLDHRSQLLKDKLVILFYFIFFFVFIYNFD
jgi:hypothetical protein